MPQKTSLESSFFGKSFMSALKKSSTYVNISCFYICAATRFPLNILTDLATPLPVIRIFCPREEPPSIIINAARKRVNFCLYCYRYYYKPLMPSLKKFLTSLYNIHPSRNIRFAWLGTNVKNTE
jgi:hypothetical protein